MQQAMGVSEEPATIKVLLKEVGCDITCDGREKYNELVWR